MITSLPPLLDLGKIHRILRIHGLQHKHYCRAVARPKWSVWPRVRRRGATFRSGCVVRGCARLHYCASVSASPSQRREWLTARRLPGCILESAASVSCSLAPMRQVSLPPRMPPPTLLGLGAERDARRAHVVGGERRDTHTQERRERERAVSLVFAPHPYSPPRSWPASSLRHPSGTDSLSPLLLLSSLL